MSEQQHFILTSPVWKTPLILCYMAQYFRKLFCVYVHISKLPEVLAFQCKQVKRYFVVYCITIIHCALLVCSLYFLSSL